MAFGTVGARVGRALLSALEGEGRYYDGAGKVADWWSKATASEFEERLSCLLGQEGGRDDDGALEGLADEGGLRLSFEAMRADRAAHPEKDRSWHGLSPDEQFFLGWAQSLCAVGAGEDLGGVPKGAGGARRRVNGAVANLSEFSLAFRCGGGAALNRSDRCEAF